MRAMGPQAAAALRLVVSGDGAPATFPGAPAAGAPREVLAEAPAARRDPWAAAAVARQRAFAARELARLQGRVGELEAENAWLRGQLDAAREAGRRDERARTARTHGGRLPSILLAD